MNKINQATELIGKVFFEQIQGQNEKISGWLTHKLKHTFCVAHDIMDILFNEEELNSTLTQSERDIIELSAILHDLGRFYQHKDGVILPNETFNHGTEAVKLLSQMPEFNNPVLLFAIEEHNNFEINYNNPLYTGLSDHDKKIADITAKLLRDADKLENMEFFTQHGYISFHSEEKGALSPDVKQYILAGKTLLRSIVKTASDRVLSGLSWVNDVYFDATRRKIREIKYLEKGMNLLRQAGATEDDCEFVKENLKV